jgi:hypothetical protein
MWPPVCREQTRAIDSVSQWLPAARARLAGLLSAEDGIKAILVRGEVDLEDSPAIELLLELVKRGLAWLEIPDTAENAEASTELRAALGVLRNVAFVLRRLSLGEDNSALRRSCDALLEQKSYAC